MSRPRVLVVARGAPAKSGLTSFVEAILGSERLASEFELGFLNTTRRPVRDGGRLSAPHVLEGLVDALRTYRAARRADVVHLNAAAWPTLPLLRALAICAAGRAAGAGVVCHVHSAEINSGVAGSFAPGPGARFLLRRLRLAHAVLAVSEAGRDALAPFVPGRLVEAVDNAVDVGGFAVAPLVGDPPHLLFVGVIGRRKGLLELIAALRQLRERGVDSWRLELVGEPTEGEEDAAAIRAAAEEAGLGDAFAGALDGAELRERLRGADVFVLPSHHEGQPMAIIEALAAGLPVVATRVGAVPGMVRDGVEGLLVDPADVDGLAAALERVLVSPDLRRRLGAAARARAEERYDVSRLAASLAPVLRSASASSTTRRTDST